VTCYELRRISVFRVAITEFRRVARLEQRKTAEHEDGVRGSLQAEARVYNNLSCPLLSQPPYSLHTYKGCRSGRVGRFHIGCRSTLAGEYLDAFALGMRFGCRSAGQSINRGASFHSPPVGRSPPLLQSRPLSPLPIQQSPFRSRYGLGDGGGVGLVG